MQTACFRRPRQPVRPRLGVRSWWAGQDRPCFCRREIRWAERPQRDKAHAQPTRIQNTHTRRSSMAQRGKGRAQRMGGGCCCRPSHALIGPSVQTPSPCSVPSGATRRGQTLFARPSARQPKPSSPPPTKASLHHEPADAKAISPGHAPPCLPSRVRSPEFPALLTLRFPSHVWPSECIAG